MRAFYDRDRTLWVRTGPDMYLTAGSKSHAERLADSGLMGSSLGTIERLYGPLRPWREEQ